MRGGVRRVHFVTSDKGTCCRACTRAERLSNLERFTYHRDRLDAKVRRWVIALSVLAFLLAITGLILGGPW